jgi:hypothetical protein
MLSRIVEVPQMATPKVRIAVAILLTVADVVVFRNCIPEIWEIWSGDPMIRCVLFFLLAIWGTSAVILWFHAAIAIRQVLLVSTSPYALRNSRVPETTHRGQDV